MRNRISESLRSNKGYVRLGVLGAGLLIAALAVYLAQIGSAQNRGATTETGGGVQTATFSYPEGNIKVFTPSDAATGDAFLAGTVSAEPAGKTDDEKERNLATLRGRVLEIEKQKVNVADKVFKLGKITATGALNVRTLDRNGNAEKQASLDLLAEQPPTPRNFEIPYLAQSGAPLTTIGPMEDTLNTSLTIGNAQAPLLAKSPRQATFRTPTNVVGPQDCTLREGEQTQSGQMNVVKLSLSAARTDLKRGETEDFTWMAEGLENLPGEAYPIALTFNNRTLSVVDMIIDGKTGETVPINIAADQVQNGKAQGRGQVRSKNTGGFFISGSLSVRDQGDRLVHITQGPFKSQRVTPDKHETQGPNKTGLKTTDDGNVHITQGPFKSQRVTPDKHETEGPNKTGLKTTDDGNVHITQGPFKSQRVPPDKHVTEGPKKTQLKTPDDGLVHLTQGPFKTQRVTADKHVTEGPKKTQLKTTDDGLVHLTQGPFKTQRVTTDKHETEGPKRTGLKTTDDGNVHLTQGPFKTQRVPPDNHVTEGPRKTGLKTPDVHLTKGFSKSQRVPPDEHVTEGPKKTGLKTTDDGNVHLTKGYFKSQRVPPDEHVTQGRRKTRLRPAPDTHPFSKGPFKS